MCLVRAPLEESTAAQTVHVWGCLEPDFSPPGLPFPVFTFPCLVFNLIRSSVLSVSGVVSFLTGPSPCSSLKSRIWFSKIIYEEVIRGSLPHTWRRVSALANSPTVCVIRWGDNSSHLISSPNMLSNYLSSLCIHLIIFSLNWCVLLKRKYLRQDFSHTEHWKAFPLLSMLMCFKTFKQWTGAMTSANK